MSRESSAAEANQGEISISSDASKRFSAILSGAHRDLLQLFMRNSEKRNGGSVFVGCNSPDESYLRIFVKTTSADDRKAKISMLQEVLQCLNQNGTLSELGLGIEETPVTDAKNNSIAFCLIRFTSGRNLREWMKLVEKLKFSFDGKDSIISQISLSVSRIDSASAYGRLAESPMQIQLAMCDFQVDKEIVDILLSRALVYLGDSTPETFLNWRLADCETRGDLVNAWLVIDTTNPTMVIQAMKLLLSSGEDFRAQARASIILNDRRNTSALMGTHFVVPPQLMGPPILVGGSGQPVYSYGINPGPQLFASPLCIPVASDNNGEVPGGFPQSRQ